MIKPTNQRSLNPYAESFFRIIGKKYSKKSSSIKRGQRAIGSFLSKADIKSYRYNIVDGSGLSRYNLIASRDIVKVLKKMNKHKNKKVFKNSLAVGGKNGTLTWRFRKTALAKRIFAKTGSMFGVRSIAGYMHTKSKKEILFSIVANHFPKNSKSVKYQIDKFLVKLEKLAR